MLGTNTHERRCRVLTLGLGAVAASAWPIYRVRSTRRGGATTRHTSALTGLHPAADLSALAPDAASIPGQPWDIGTGVTGYVWHAPAPRAALLLQHGYAEHTHRYLNHYYQLIPHLLHTGISVYAFDLWGHGLSPGRRAVTDAGHAVRDHLTARRKLQGQPLPVFLLGHSLGGLITAASVARDQRGVQGVILSSPALKPPSGDGAPLRLLANVLAALAPTLPAPVRPPDVDGLSGIPDELAAFAADPLIYHGRMPILLAATSLNEMAGISRRSAGWSVPTLALHGTADTYTDPAGSRALIAAIASEDKTLHVVEGGRHELLNDTRREETLRVLLTWLKQRLPA